MRCVSTSIRRWLTVLKGIAYFVYCFPGHRGGVALADGTPTPLCHALKTLNREFVAIARELQPLKSRGIFHSGMLPPGTTRLPKTAVFHFEPAIPDGEYRPAERGRGAQQLRHR